MKAEAEVGQYRKRKHKRPPSLLRLPDRKTRGSAVSANTKYAFAYKSSASAFTAGNKGIKLYFARCLTAVGGVCGWLAAGVQGILKAREAAGCRAALYIKPYGRHIKSPPCKNRGYKALCKRTTAADVFCFFKRRTRDTCPEVSFYGVSRFFCGCKALKRGSSRPL